MTVRSAVVFLAAAGLAGCATLRPSPTDEPAVVSVTNHGLIEASVWAISDDSTWAVGTVSPSQSASFRVAPGVYLGGRTALYVTRTTRTTTSLLYPNGNRRRPSDASGPGTFSAGSEVERRQRPVVATERKPNSLAFSFERRPAE